MSTKLTYKTSTSSGEETRELSKKIGRRLKGGEILVLNGDLGFGKTEFVKGLVLGAGIKEEVTSPSFTISNLYKGEKLTIHHMDFYRINDAGILKDELSEIFEDKNNVVVIEWANIVLDAVPSNAVMVDIINHGESNREFIFHYSEDRGYLFKDLR